MEIYSITFPSDPEGPAAVHHPVLAVPRGVDCCSAISESIDGQLPLNDRADGSHDP